MACKIVLILLVIFLNTSFAEEANITLYDKTLDNTSEARKFITNNLLDVSRDLDLYLSNRNNKKFKNGTNIKLTFSTYKQESESFKNDVKFRLRIRLPNTEKKLKLIIIDEKDNTDIKDNEYKNIDESEQSVALQYSIIDKFKQSLKASVGLRLTEEVHRYIKLKYKTSFLINKVIIGKFEQKFRYSSNNKLVTTSSIDFTKFLNYTFILNNYNEYKWEKDDEINTLFNSIKLYQILSKREYFGYSITKEENDFESSLSTKEYQIIFQYRKYIKEWLYFEIIPKVRYMREHDFSARHQLRFNLSFYFGRD